MPHKHMKKCVKSLVIREILIQTTIGYHFLKNRMAIIKNTDNNCDPYQNYNCIFLRTRTNNSKICIELLKILKSQNNLEKREQNWKYHTP